MQYTGCRKIRLFSYRRIRYGTNLQGHLERKNGMVKIYKEENYEKLSEKAASIIAYVVVLKPDCVLGLATGTSPIGTYRKLIGWYEDGLLDFSRVKTANLDEYRGLPGTHNQSYRYFMNDNLFDHVNIDKTNTNVPNGIAGSVEEECKRYDKLITDLGGVDLQLLGIGRNGHIGFNEPAEDFPKGTHLVDLTESTINANSRLFERKEDVPHQALTMGIGTVMSARKVLLIACGADKAQAIRDSFYGPITPHVPASILQLHPDVTVVCDPAALSLTPLA